MSSNNNNDGSSTSTTPQQRTIHTHDTTKQRDHHQKKKNTRISSPSGGMTPRGPKKGTIRTERTREYWYNLCALYDKTYSKQNMKQVDFLRSDHSGKDIVGTTSNCVSFCAYLKKYKSGQLKPNTNLRQSVSKFPEIEQKLIDYINEDNTRRQQRRRQLQKKRRRRRDSSTNTNNNIDHNTRKGEEEDENDNHDDDDDKTSGGILSLPFLAAKCMEWAAEMNVHDEKYKYFKASDGFISNCMKRHGIVGIKKNNHGGDEDDDEYYNDDEEEEQQVSDDDGNNDHSGMDPEELDRISNEFRTELLAQPQQKQQGIEKEAGNLESEDDDDDNENDNNDDENDIGMSITNFEQAHKMFVELSKFAEKVNMSDRSQLMLAKFGHDLRDHEMEQQRQQRRQSTTASTAVAAKKQKKR